MKSEFEIAITQLSSDRDLAPGIILDAIEKALASAYKRNFNSTQNVVVTIDPHTGQARVLVQKLVVELMEDDQTQISLGDARKTKPTAVIGDLIEFELTPKNFGRIAAQTAKQVIMQKIREAERDSVFLEYQDRAGEIVNGVVRNIDARTQNVTISLGKAEAMLDYVEQIPGEHYRFNQRLRVYVVDVERGGHGPQITVSRTHKGLLRRLLELEVPEIFNGIVEIKSIAREPGSRSKVAVGAMQPGIDPVGSCVGMRGVRIQNIVNELNGEKIDVVAWSSDMATFISNSLSPAKVSAVYMNEVEKTAKVIVPDKALSLAIGKEGQNARLAAKLTMYRIDIRSESEAATDQERLNAEAALAAEQANELQTQRQAAAQLLAEANASLAEEDGIVTSTIELPVEPIAESASPVVAEVSAIETPLEQPFVPEPDLATLPLEDVLSIPVSAPISVPTPSTPSVAEVFEPEVLEDDEEESKAKEGGKPVRKDKSKQRTLVFDETLGRVVSKQRRKPGRSAGWEIEDEE